MSKTATLAQTIKVLSLIDQDETPCEQLQQVLGSGLLSDLLHANFGLGIDRNEVRKALRLRPLESSSPILWTIEDDGRTNDELIAALETKGIEVSDYAKQIIAKANEPVPSKGTAYQLVGIKGVEFATDAKRTTKHIFAEAARPERNYGKPSLRAGLLLREKFSQEQLGYPYVVVMNEPVSGSDGDPLVLALGRNDDGDWLYAWHASPDGQWFRDGLFVFLAPQVAALEVRRGDVKLVESDFFRETGELTVQISALPRPTLAELQSKFDWIKRIERDSSPTDAMTLKLATVLRTGEGWSIVGKEYERRIAAKLDIILGYQQAVWLVEHQYGFPEFMALLGRVHVDFTGLVVVAASGLRHYPYLSKVDEGWYLAWDMVGSAFSSNKRIASSGK